MAYEIDEIRKVKLGGVNQKIHIRSEKKSNPVLLFLHGGPGVTNRHGVLARHSDLCDDFTIVCWDQRGTGGSYWGVKDESLNLNQLIEDGAELIEYLCKSLGKEKIFIQGGSWGTELGTYLCIRHPEHIAGYIGSGQVVDGVLNEELSYDFAYTKAKEAGNEEDIKTLEEILKSNGTYWTDTALPDAILYLPGQTR